MREKEMKSRVTLVGVVLAVLMICVNSLMWATNPYDFLESVVLVVPSLFLLICVGWVKVERPIRRPLPKPKKPEAILFTGATAQNMRVLYMFFSIVWFITTLAQQLRWEKWVVAVISIMALPLFLVYKATVGSQGYWGLMILNNVPVLQYFATRDILDAGVEQSGCGGVAIAIPHRGLFGQTWIESKVAGWQIKRVWLGKTDALLIDPYKVGIPLYIERDSGDYRLKNVVFDLAKLLEAGSVNAYMLEREKESNKIANALLLERVEVDRQSERMLQEASLKTARDRHEQTIRCDFRTIVLLGKTPKTKKARAELQANAMRFLGGDEAVYAQYLAQAKWELGVQ